MAYYDHKEKHTLTNTVAVGPVLENKCCFFTFIYPVERLSTSSPRKTWKCVILESRFKRGVGSLPSGLLTEAGICL